MPSRTRRPRPRRRLAGLSLVEAAAVVCVAGVVLAVFIPTFIRELRTSKTSEASENLRLLYQHSAAYFVTRHPPPDGEGSPRSQCLPPTAGPTPRVPTESPRSVDFGDESTPGHETWTALGFAPAIEVRYAYSFEPTSAGCNLRSPPSTYLLTLRAEGDLDGDGERSVFERRARANDHGELQPVGILYVRDRME